MKPKYIGSAIIAVLVVTGGLLYHLNHEFRYRSIAQPIELKHVENLPDESESVEMTKNNGKGKRAVEPPVGEVKSFSALRKEVEQVFGDYEASRSTMLLEAKRGTNYCYLLGVEPPSQEEIASLRKYISELQHQVSKNDSQRLDDYLGKMISRYDCFGVDGRKAIYILIPEDFETKAISGTTFSVDDFEEVKKVFDPNIPLVEFPYRNVKPYIRGDTKMLSRFQSLIRTE
jgi:hypothetical protein